PATPGSILGLPLFCENQTGAAYSIAPLPDAQTYTWSVPPGAVIVSGQGTPNIVVDFGTMAGDISVTASNFCGTSSAMQLPVSPSVPVASFTPTAGSINNPVSFAGGGGYSGYSWIFPSGNPATSGIQNPG